MKIIYNLNTDVQRVMNIINIVKIRVRIPDIYKHFPYTYKKYLNPCKIWEK